MGVWAADPVPFCSASRPRCTAGRENCEVSLYELVLDLRLCSPPCAGVQRCCLLQYLTMYSCNLSPERLHRLSICPRIHEIAAPEYQPGRAPCCPLMRNGLYCLLPPRRSLLSATTCYYLVLRSITCVNDTTGPTPSSRIRFDRNLPASSSDASHWVSDTSARWVSASRPEKRQL